jgi:hypothetical protein
LESNSSFSIASWAGEIARSTSRNMTSSIAS